MPSKSQQETNDPDITRTQSTMTSNAKFSTQSKRNISGATKITNDLATVIGVNRQPTINVKPLKIITEVDETNIDEVLNLSDLSTVPKSFLTEIQQDQVYGTIFESLKKKILHQKSSSPPIDGDTFGIDQFNDDDDEDDDDDDIDRQSHSRTISPDADGHGKQFDDDQSSMDELGSSISSTHMIGNLNDGYDTDIEPEAVPIEDPDVSGKLKYREYCQQSKLIPCSYFMAHIEDRELTLRYHQFSNDDVRAIARTLSSNLFVERLLLDGNSIQRQAAKYITQMIITNDFITDLSLADNNLGGGEGTKELCRMLMMNRNLKKINLSGNQLNDNDVIQLVEAFENNKILRELDLSNNNFGEECGKVLGSFISGNDSLDSIDLSGNRIRGRSAIDIANGIKENVRLKRCNLERNGFGPEEGRTIGDCIRQNGALEELNVSWNRLSTINAFGVAEGLQVNDSLQVLKIGNNQINSDGALAIFLAIKANESSSIREIDFAQTVVTRETFDTCKDIIKLREGKFQYKIGKVITDGLQANAASECYPKIEEDLLKKFQSMAAKVKVS